MIPIERFKIYKRSFENTEYFQGDFSYREQVALTAADKTSPDKEEWIKRKMKERFWRAVYGDLRQPLAELMCLAHRAAISNPSAYPELARIEELTKQLNDLLDWQKQIKD